MGFTRCLHQPSLMDLFNACIICKKTTECRQIIDLNVTIYGVRKKKREGSLHEREREREGLPPTATPQKERSTPSALTSFTGKKRRRAGHL
mmetsp:Transcript_37423/g.73651  ORF Transcript_37423/g.73651 Transcript_37423/m.73651 type:complete len:91 (+) Transcript_37423:1111-1383(+)